MPVNLDDLEPPPRAADTRELVAEPGVAPLAYQSLFDTTTRTPPVENSPDLRRILALPRRPPPDGRDMVAALSAYLAKKRPSPCRCRALDPKRFEDGADGCVKTLRPIQAAALAEIGRYGGFLGPIGTGFGKTLVELLAPWMLARHGVRSTLLLVPAPLVAQIERDVILYGQHFEMPDVIVQGSTANLRNEGAPLLQVMSYSRLSLATSTAFLANLRPDAIIFDECQNVRAIPDGAARGSTRAGRVYDFIAAHPCRVLAQSGSMTDADLDDYGHFADWALANPANPTDFDTHRSPLPINREERKAWNSVIGAKGDLSAAGALLKLCNPGENVRDGFRRRLHETPGVIATTEAVIAADLSIGERRVKVPGNVRDMLELVRTTWQRPDGEELTNPLDVARCLRELACGMYLRWIFPRGEPYELIIEWLEARKEWHKEMREALRTRTPHMDSPLLCARAAARAWGDEQPVEFDALDPEFDDNDSFSSDCSAALPTWKAASWPRWCDIKGAVRPETEAVRVSDYLAADAAEWGRTHRGIIWYETVGFGAWVAELSGLTWRHPGDPLIDPSTKALRLPDDGSSVILTARSYGTGIDGLQHRYSTQLFTQFASSAEKAEQTLGRLYRVGQRAKCVTADVYRCTPELRAAVDEAVMRAKYVQETMGQTQKLLIGWSDA